MKYVAILALLLLTACGSSLPESEFISFETYERKSWGHWIDEDNDCQDTRQELLIRYSFIPVTFKTEKRCKVKTGDWLCVFTGKSFTDPSKLDIDHLVPVQEAHLSGGMNWNPRKRQIYYNDQSGLLPVSASSNRSKGSKQPHEWLPEHPSSACQYMREWIRIKTKWKLEYDLKEARELLRLYGEKCLVKE